MRSYDGPSVRPRREPIVYRCACGERFQARVWRAISADDGALRTRLIEGDLNRVRCPRCDVTADVQVTVLYHDSTLGLLVYVAPSSERHRELGLRAELFAMLATDATPPEDYVLAADVVFGAAGLSELLAGGQRASHAEPVITESPTEMITASHTALAPALPPMTEARPAEPTTMSAATPAAAAAPKAPGPMATVPDLDAVLAASRAHRDAARLSSATTASPRSARVDTVEITVPTSPAVALVTSAPLGRAEGDTTQPRATVAVPDPRTAVIERWIAARESDTAMFVDERVVVCASLPAATLEAFVAREGRKARVSLRPQLHRMSTFPVIALTFIAHLGEDDGQRPDEARVIHVPLDLARAAHRVALDQLQRRCVIELELFDTEYLPVVSLQLTAPLEDHLRHLVAEAKTAIERLAVGTRSFDRARAAFLSSGYDRLGRTVIDLPSLDDVTRGTPAVVRAALHAVSRWSEAAAEGYLLEIRGFPLPQWRKLAATVLRRAVEIGLFVPRGLAERVARRSPPSAPDGLDLPPWAELIELEVRRFAELSARLRPSDLSPSDEAANWELLLREAETQRIPIDDAVRKLAEAAFERAGGRPSRRARSVAPRIAGGGSPAPKGPPRPAGAPAPAALPTSDLLLLLDDRDRRLEAAITIAERHEVPALPALFGVLRRMSRLEANALLPRLAGFGAPAERWLVDGLRSKKAFMRQGCALGLGRLATPLAIDALVRLLFDEPTEIWTEIARAVGDVGAAAVMPLAARLREVEGDARDRIVQALAHIAARSADGGPPANRAAVEALANGRDALVSNVARRALVLAPEVHSAHHAVKSERREQTLVRAFTRRFYDALDGEGGELDAEMIDELDSDELEALDDQDDLDDDIEPLFESAGPRIAPAPTLVASPAQAPAGGNVGVTPTMAPSPVASAARRPPGR